MTIHALESQEISSGIREITKFPEPTVDGSLAGRLRARQRELAEGERGVPQAQERDFAQWLRQRVEPTCSPETAHRADLLVRGAARADEVGMIGVREPVSP